MAVTSGSLSSGGIVVPPASGWGDSGVTSTLNPDGSVSWCCTTWIVPLPVAAGDVLGTVSIPVRDNGPDNGFSSGGNNVVVMVGTPSADGSTFNVLQFTTTSGAGDLATMTLTFATPHTVAAGENLQIRLRAQTPGIFGPTPATHVSWSGPATAAPPAPTISTPVMQAGNTNDWSPAGFVAATVIRISTGSGHPFLTGLSGGIDGRTVTLVMASIGDPLTLTRLDGSSASANRFMLPLPPGATFLQMTAIDQAITLAYDGIASKWRVIAKNF